MAPDAEAGREPLPDMGGAAGKAVMPAAYHVVPFSFTLPLLMPSTLEASVPWTDYAFSRCSIYANIDVAWRMDPSARALITIVQPLPASLPRLLAPAAFERGPVRPVFGLAGFAKACPGLCACLCCCCEMCSSDGILANTNDKCALVCPRRCPLIHPLPSSSDDVGRCPALLKPPKYSENPPPRIPRRLGDVHLMCRLERTGLVPGEPVGLSLRVSNSSPAALNLRVEFVRHFRCTSHVLLGAGPVVSAEVRQVVVAEQARKEAPDPSSSFSS